MSILDTVHPPTKRNLPIPRAVWRNPWYFIAFGFGAGAIPIAPGTFGTLMAIPFYLMLRPLPLWLYIFFVLIFIAASIYLSDRISKAMQIHDHPGMCIDEFAGFFVTMINAPLGLYWILLGFLLFRVFDILKPWPIGWLDKNLEGGLGIILDDVLAGLYSFILLQLVAILFQK